MVLIQKAVSRKTGHIKFYPTEHHPAGGRIYNSSEAQRSIEIESVRLDDYFKDYKGKIDFIKMDVEGSEFLALEGMQDLLKRERKVKIVTEFYPRSINLTGKGPKEYLKLLASLGFEAFQIDEKSKRVEAIRNIPKLLEIDIPKQGGFTNLLCIRKE